LSGDRAKKQATIFRACCIEDTLLMRQKDKDDAIRPRRRYGGMATSILKPMKKWNQQVNYQKERSKVYHKDLEKDAIQTRDPINEAKLSRKYGGLFWNNKDNDNALLYADNDNMYWQRPNKNCGGYCVRVYDKDYRDNNNSKESRVEPWEISVDLIHCIAVYYKAHRHEGVQVVDNQPTVADVPIHTNK
jgi:hypothetical protein